MPRCRQQCRLDCTKSPEFLKNGKQMSESGGYSRICKGALKKVSSTPQGKQQQLVSFLGGNTGGVGFQENISMPPPGRLNIWPKTNQNKENRTNTPPEPATIARMSTPAVNTPCHQYMLITFCILDQMSKV